MLKMLGFFADECFIFNTLFHNFHIFESHDWLE